MLELFTDTLQRAEVMGVGDHIAEESLQRRAANRPQFYGRRASRRLSSGVRSTPAGKRPAPSDGVVRRAVAYRGQADVFGPVEDEQQAAAEFDEGW